MRTAAQIKTVLTCCFVFGFLLVALSSGAERRVLVYTKNGKGFVHDNIAASVKAIQELGRENNFAVDVSTNPAVFTDANLKQFRALVFCNSNNEAFDTDEQRDAFKRYIQSGGGFAGIHSASGSERQWPYYWAVLGGKFVRHPPLQPFTIQVVDARHPATAHLGKTWQWTDECYFLDNLNPDVHVLLAVDLKTLKDPQAEKYPGKTFGDYFPLSWCHEFDGGREFYTAIGHKIEHYSDPNLRKHILGGILWAMGETKDNQ
jgi:uncharacterized protein